jgi:hypothetical protein
MREQPFWQRNYSFVFPKSSLSGSFVTTMDAPPILRKSPKSNIGLPAPLVLKYVHSWELQEQCKIGSRIMRQFPTHSQALLIIMFLSFGQMRYSKLWTFSNMPSYHPLLSIPLVILHRTKSSWLSTLNTLPVGGSYHKSPRVNGTHHVLGPLPGMIVN